MFNHYIVASQYVFLAGGKLSATSLQNLSPKLDMINAIVFDADKIIFTRNKTQELFGFLSNKLKLPNVLRCKRNSAFKN